MKKRIGGYFGLELSYKKPFLHSDGCCLNSGRNALGYILSSLPSVSKLWLPAFTCSSVLEPVKKLHIPFAFYSINEDLEMREILSLQAGEYILVNNYFGIKDAYIQRMAANYGDRLIVDNAQAFYAPSLKNIKTIYSPRKFFGVPDGGIAYGVNALDLECYEREESYTRCNHLLKRHDLGAEAGYHDFAENDRKMKNQSIRRMSRLTTCLLNAVDFDEVEEKRRTNFSFLHQSLAKSNLLKMPGMDTLSCPMVYPYYSSDAGLRQKLISQKVFVATYWPNVLEEMPKDTLEYHLSSNLIPLPIDQRYDVDTMNEILEIIKL